jgi:hypothetical protein
MWMVNEKHLAACGEAFKFYCWLLQLKKVVFLPAHRPSELDWRLRQVKKCIKKMPELTAVFFSALQEIESILPANLNKEDKNFLLEKRNRIKTFIDFLKRINEPGVESLRKTLLESNLVKYYWRTS